jgi:hypothetical protein
LHFRAVAESPLAPGVKANAADWMARVNHFRRKPK